MKVILTQDVKGQGKKGQMIEVSDGYGRNFLLAKGLAVEANASNVNVMKTKQAAEEARKAKELAEAKALATQLSKITLTIRVKAGENGKLFGAVSTKDISDELKKQYQFDVDKKKLVLREMIKSLGTYEVQAKLYSEVSAKFNVIVAEA